MRYFIPILLWVSVLHFTTPTMGQEYSYAHYEVRDGLAGSVVYHGAEDKEGFLWFATETGVSRFDGTHFRNFTTRDGLPDNEILRIYVDARGRVWMQPFGNAVCYYYNGKIHNQQNDSLLKQLRFASEVIDMVGDVKGNMFIAERRGIYYLNFQTQKITQVVKYESPVLIKIGFTHEGHLGFVSNGGTFGGNYIKLNLKNFSEISCQPIPIASIHKTWISPSLEILDTKDSLHCNDPATQKRLSTLAIPMLKSISQINDSLLTINSSNGSIIYNFRTGQRQHGCLEGINVNTAMRDREGNYWFMTHGSGVYRMGSFDFFNYRFNPDQHNYLSVTGINSIDGQVYVGAEKAILYRLTNTKVSAPQYLLGKDAFGRILTINGRGDEILLGTDQSVVQLRHGRLRLGDLPAAVKSVNPYKNKWLVGSTPGLYLMNDSLKFNNTIFHQRTTAVEVQHDTIYMGSTNGLYRLTGWPLQPTMLGDVFPVFNGRITAIKSAPDGTLWVATNGKGLVGYRNNRITHIFTEREGLSSNICRALFISADDLWLGTDKGLNRIRWQQSGRSITTYTIEDGLLANIVNCVYADSSMVYVGTQAGLTVFDPEKISRNSVCDLRITGIRSAEADWHYDTADFRLPARQNEIRFDFVGISYRSAGDITYRYRLVGLNQEWQMTRETNLSYPSLPSGDYELQLQAINKFGVESALIKRTFVVEKLLWEKTWFRIAVVFGAWLLIWLFVRMRIKRVRSQNEEKMLLKNRMAELEQMALKAQMNPHFIFNSLNSVQQYVFDKDVLGANKFITEFSRLIRLTLDLSSRSSISIQEEISYLSTYLELEKTKLEDKFTYSVAVSSDLQPDNYHIPPMILQPFVENSVRHGVRNRRDKKGHISVSFSTSTTHLICQVEDNGVGRKKASQYKSEMHIEYQSKGMTLTQRRIDMLNRGYTQPVLIGIEDLYEQDQPTGTLVTLRFPLQDTGKDR